MKLSIRARRSWVVAIASTFLLVVAAGCAVRLVVPKVTLEVNKAHWKAADIEDYEFQFKLNCLCNWPSTEPVVIGVADNRIVAVTRVRDGEVLPAEAFARYRTVEGLFDLIQRKIGELPADLSVTYDPDLGFPVEIRIDHSARIADDESGYRVAWLMPID